MVKNRIRQERSNLVRDSLADTFAMLKFNLKQTGYLCFLGVLWLFLVFARPFTSIVELTTIEAVQFWTVLLPTATLLCMFGMMFAKNVRGSFSDYGLIDVAAGSTVASFVVSAWGILLVELITKQAAPPFFQVLFYAILTSVAASILVFLIWTKPALELEEKATIVDFELPDFINRLPVEARGEVKLVSVEDHYVRVVTVAGEGLILMSLKDAIDQLDDKQGRQVHRSFWVAKKFTRDVTRKRGKVTIEMDNGTQVPVSATYKSNLDFVT